MKKSKQFLFHCFFGMAVCALGSVSAEIEEASTEQAIACCQCGKSQEEKPEREREKNYSANYDWLV